MTPTLEQLSTVIARIHEAGPAPEKWPEALAAVVALLQASRGALMDMAADSGALLALDQVGHDPGTAKLYVEHYYNVDPTRALALSYPALKAMIGSEQFSAAFRARDEYFDFARRSDIGDVVGITTRVDEGRRHILSLQRPCGAADFDAHAKALMGLLAPHFELAKRVQCTLAQATADKSALQACLDRLSSAALVVDAQARVRHLNAAAQALFVRHDGIVYRNGALRFMAPALDAAFQAALRRAACEEGRSSALDIRLSAGAAGELLVAPLEAGSFPGAPAGPTAFVLIATSPADERAIATRLQSAYRLTPAEARVAALLAMGQSVEEIAAANEVSYATVRSQVRSILAKTGARRQADIVRIALTGALLRRDR